MRKILLSSAVLIALSRAVAPANFDWSQEGVQTAQIYDQGFRADGGVFAAIAALELQYQVKYGGGHKPRFSSQQIIDCMPNFNG